MNQFFLTSHLLFQIYELYVKLEDFDGVEKYARFSLFVIDGENTGYRLSVLGDYNGTAGNNNNQDEVTSKRIRLKIARTFKVSQVFHVFVFIMLFLKVF